MSRFGTYLGSGGHGSIRFQYNLKKKEIYYARFILIYFEQTVVQIKKNPSRCENTMFSQIKADLYTVIINKTIRV